MDILRVLASAALEVRQKTLALVLELVTSRNIDEVHVTITILLTFHSDNICIIATVVF